MLSPESAWARLLALATQVDMTGRVTINLPYIGSSGRPATVPFVGEGLPMRITNLTVSPTVLGPTKKLLIGAALTTELQNLSGDQAAAIIGSALAISAGQSMDALLFSASAATAAAPAGILNGVAGIVGTSGGGLTAIISDMAALADAIATAGINSQDMVIITTPKLGEKIALVPNFTHTVLTSAAIAAGTVIAIVPSGLASGHDGTITIDVVTEPAVHMEDTTPTDISTSGSAVAYPTVSMFQTESLAVKVRGWCAWAVHPGSVAWISGASW
jgi:hypothetical protein